MDLNAFFKITYGVYIITTKLGEKENGMVATAVCQVTAEPVRMTLGINKESLTHEIIQKTGFVGVNALRQETDFNFIGGFGFKSGRIADKLKGVSFTSGLTGVPLLADNTVAVFEGRVIGSMDAGTHTIFLTEAVDARILTEEAPLSYEYYHKVIKGKSPKFAPTFVVNKA
jgi:flavin reductase (DIM6/NTAB) family NADH-FMN oxidoreductase RutF